MKQKYLSDEELTALIMDVEQNDLVAAPPSLRGQIVDTIDTLEKKKSQIVEFKRFKAKIIASVAVVILFVLVGPEVKNRIPESAQISIPKINFERTDRRERFNLGDSHFISNMLIGRTGDNNNETY